MNASRIVLLVGAACAAGSLAPASVATTPAQVNRYEEFKTKFRQALTLSASDEIAKLVKSYPQETIDFVDSLCAQMAIGNSEQLEKEFNALTRAWKEANKSAFVEKLYVYHSELALDPVRRSERNKLVRSYNVTLTKFLDNLKGAKEGSVFELAGQEFSGMADAFAELGDHYFAARASCDGASCFDDGNRGKNASLRRACELYGRGVKHFDAVELNHPYYYQTKQRWEALVRAGHAEPLPDPNAPQPGTPTPKAAPAITAMSTFEIIKNADQFVRPCYFNDEVYQLWPAIALAKKGTSGTFQALEKGPLLLRTDSAKLGLDFDRDGNVDKPLSLTGNFVTVDFDIGEGDARRRWAFVFKTGLEQDKFQGLTINLQPSDEQAQIYCMNAGSVVAQISGVSVRVIDDNMDGVYGSEPRTYSYGGITEGLFQPDMDSIVVGESKRARPWSQYVELGGAWYELAAERGGVAFKATPVDVATGTLRLDFKGPTPNWVVVKGTGQLEKCWFDLITDSKQPVAVPAGIYELYCGEIRTGKKQQVFKSLMLPGPNTQKWTVNVGAETVVKLGAPFGFEFASEKGEEQVKVKGKSVTIVGVARERYERPWNCAPRPEVAWRKAGSKKGSKPEKIDLVLDLYEQADDGTTKWTMNDTWRPIDTSVEIKKGDTVELQLTEKKNKLFGEIESTWN